MSKIKLICCDMDGTLLDDNKNIAEGNREAIRDAVRRGICLSLVSGRLSSSVRLYLDELGIVGPVSSLGGCLLQDENMTIIDQYNISLPVCRTILNLAKKHDCEIFMYHHENMYINKWSPWLEREERLSRVKGNVLDFNTCLEKNLPNKMLAMSNNPAILQEMISDLKLHLSDQIGCFLSAPEYIEIVPGGVNKGTAVNSLCRHLGLQPDQVLALGDYYNDIDMFNASGLSVAMANSPEGVKTKAQFVTQKDNNHGGVAEAIYNFT